MQYPRLTNTESLQQPIRQWLRLVTAWLSLSAAAQTLPAQNFTSHEPELQQTAEAARLRSARFWSGQPLAGNWFAPCPIHWSQQQGPGHGMTRFQIADGEVFGWCMSVSWDRPTVLADVLPHEVDHTVRATLVRRPLPRWLDEGCASLFESEATHARLREHLLTNRPRSVTAATIDSLDYPSSSALNQQLYAEGFSLVEFLLTQGTPQDLLAVQRSTRPPSQALPEVYRTELPQLLITWRQWERTRLQSGPRCDCVRCPWHHPSGQPSKGAPAAPATDTRPSLVVWSASWCGPCQQFQRDWLNDHTFRSTIEQSFQLSIRDVDQAPADARRAGVLSVPVFIAGDRRIMGYCGPDWLLKELSLTRHPDSESPPLPVVSSPPAKTQPLLTPAAEPTPLAPRATPPIVTLPAPSPTTASWPERILSSVPSVVTVLTSLGVIGGTALTGGAGGVALMVLGNMLKRRLARRAGTSSKEGGVAPTAPTPFPRHLDEARELLELRQSEGRVATLDTLRGMFLNDELDKLKDDPDSRTRQVISRVRSAIDTRVEEAAPLTTQV